MSPSEIIEQEVAILEPILIRGQFNQAIRELRRTFEKHVEGGELDEARVVVGLANRPRRHEV